MTNYNPESIRNSLSKQYDTGFVDLFLGNGAKVYLFGGVPRDLVLGREWKDADFCICIPGSLEEKDAIAERIFLKGKIVLTSKTVLPNGITVYRFKDQTSDQTIDTRVVNDIWAGGADFTINSMRLDLETGELLDRYSAVLDIENKILRTIVPPEERFSQDYTMLFRAVKAACQLDFEIDASVRDTMKSFTNHVIICIDIIVRNESDFSEWVLSSVFAGLATNACRYYSLHEEAGTIETLQADIAKRLSLSQVTEKPVNPFSSKQIYTFEEALSMLISSIARSLNAKLAEELFIQVAELLQINTSKRGDDFIVDRSKITYIP